MLAKKSQDRFEEFVSDVANKNGKNLKNCNCISFSWDNRCNEGKREEKRKKDGGK